MKEKIVIHVHLGGIETSREHNASETKTLEALVALLIKAGHFSDAKVEDICVFEEDSDTELPRDHRFGPEHHGKRYHVHRCKNIEVKFIAVDESKTETFRPSATIARLLKWAKKHFPSDPQKKYELRLTTEGEPLPPAEHIGAYAKAPHCAVTLYFTPSCNILG